MRTARPILKTQRLTTPRAAAIAGILFSLLFGTALFLIRLSIPDDPHTSAAYFAQNIDRIKFALSLIPYSAIAFLWFIGVIRSHLGKLEDQFFSTIFFGSGILFLTVELVTAAVAGGLVASFASSLDKLVDSGVYIVFRLTLFNLVNIYMIRMEGVFMISLATIWMRTRVMPLWLAIITFVVAFMLLVSTSLSSWLTLFFPGWVLLISLYMLVLNLRRPEAPDNLVDENE